MNSDAWIEAMNKEVNKIIGVRDRVRAMSTLEGVVDNANRTSVLARLSQEFSAATAALTTLADDIQSLEKIGESVLNNSNVEGGAE